MRWVEDNKSLRMAQYDVKGVKESLDISIEDMENLTDILTDHQLDKALDNLVLAYFWIGRYLDEAEQRNGQRLPGSSADGDSPS